MRVFFSPFANVRGDGLKEKEIKPTARPSNRSILDRVAVNDGRRARIDRIFVAQ